MFAVARDTTNRAGRKQRPGELHDAAGQFIDATTVEAAVSVTVEAAEEILDLDINGFHTPDEAGDPLVPVAVS